MLIICISNVHLSVPPPTSAEDAGKKSNGGGSNSMRGPISSNHNKPRVTGESVALIVLYEYARCVANRVYALVQNANNNSNIGNHNKKGGNSGYRLMPVLSVLGDWLEGHAQYLLSCQASLNGQGKEDVLLYSSESLISAEGQSRSAMRQSLLRVVEALEAPTSNSAKSLWQPPVGRSFVGEVSKPLREHIELRGYVPLFEAYECYFSQQKTDHPTNPSVIPAHVAEEAARDRRTKRLLWFVKEHVTHCAQREAKEAEGRRLAAVKEREQEDHLKASRQRGPGFAPEPIGDGHTQATSDPSSFAYSTSSNTLAVESTGDNNVMVSSSAQDLNTAGFLQPCDEEEGSLGEEVVFRPGFAQPASSSEAPTAKSSKVEDARVQAKKKVTLVVEGDQPDKNYSSSFSSLHHGIPTEAMELESESNGRVSPWWESHCNEDSTSKPLVSGVGEVNDIPPGLGGVPPGLGGVPPGLGGVPPGLFGGIDSSNRGLSLLQRIHDASMKGDVEVDRFGDLILPPPDHQLHKARLSCPTLPTPSFIRTKNVKMNTIVCHFIN